LKATYEDGVLTDPTPLCSPETIRTQLAVGLAHGVHNWILVVGWTPSSPSVEAIARQTRLAKRWQAEAVGAKPCANVVSIFSSRQREYLAGGIRSMLPSHLDKLREAQIPIEPLRDLHLPTFDLGPYQAVIAEGMACLTDGEVQSLVKWVKAGGTLLATPDVATHDAVGRKRPSSLLAQSLGVTLAGTQPVESGRVVWCSSGSDIVQALRQYAKPIVEIEPKDARWEVTVYRQATLQQFWVHVIDHGGASAKQTYLKLRLPNAIKIAHAGLWTDTGDHEARWTQDGSHLRVTLPTGVAHVIAGVQAE